MGGLKITGTSGYQYIITMYDYLQNVTSSVILSLVYQYELFLTHATKHRLYIYILLSPACLMNIHDLYSLQITFQK